MIPVAYLQKAGISLRAQAVYSCSAVRCSRGRSSLHLGKSSLLVGRANVDGLGAAIFGVPLGDYHLGSREGNRPFKLWQRAIRAALEVGALLANLLARVVVKQAEYAS